MDYSKLQQSYDEANTTDEAFLAAYNAPSVIRLHDVLMADVFNSIMKSGVWDKLDAAAENVALDAIHPTIRRKIKKFLAAPAAGIPYLNPETSELVDNMPGVVQLGIVTQAEADDFIAQFQEFVSQSFIDQGSETTQTDLNVMRLLPKIATATAQRDSLTQQASALDSAIQQMWQGVDMELPA